MLPRSQRLTLFRPPERIEETAMPAYEEPIAAVTLRRGPCFGSCPVYELTLAAPAQRRGGAAHAGSRPVQTGHLRHPGIRVRASTSMRRLSRNGTECSGELGVW